MPTYQQIIDTIDSYRASHGCRSPGFKGAIMYELLFEGFEKIHIDEKTRETYCIFHGNIAEVWKCGRLVSITSVFNSYHFKKTYINEFSFDQRGELIKHINSDQISLMLTAHMALHCSFSYDFQGIELYNAKTNKHYVCRYRPRRGTQCIGATDLSDDCINLVQNIDGWELRPCVYISEFITEKFPNLKCRRESSPIKKIPVAVIDMFRRLLRRKCKRIISARINQFIPIKDIANLISSYYGMTDPAYQIGVNQGRREIIIKIASYFMDKSAAA